MRGRIVVQVLLAILAAGCGRNTALDYTSPEGRYRVQFTGKPKLQEQTVPTVLGPITAKIASTEDWSGTLRRVMYADYPPHPIQFGNKDAILDNSCQGMATEAQLVILNKLTISINGYPGRDVSFESQPVRSGAKIMGRGGSTWSAIASIRSSSPDGPIGWSRSRWPNSSTPSSSWIKVPGRRCPAYPAGLHRSVRRRSIGRDLPRTRQAGSGPLPILASGPGPVPGRAERGHWASTTSPSRHPRRSRPTSRGWARRPRIDPRAPT